MDNRMNSRTSVARHFCFEIYGEPHAISNVIIQSSELLAVLSQFVFYLSPGPPGSFFNPARHVSASVVLNPIERLEDFRITLFSFVPENS